MKGCFPHLKIGGPSLAKDGIWSEDFLAAMQERNVPIDFLSWHCYAESPEPMLKRAQRLRASLDAHGYANTESILNEWNYSWIGGFLSVVKTIHSIKGAAYAMACICAAQDSSIDMLMYYDTRPSVYNGAFDFYTYEKLKGYYPLYWYGMFYDMEKEIKAENQIENIYSLCGVSKDNKVLAIVTHYNVEDDIAAKTVCVD